jgi:hypothetical protein
MAAISPTHCQQVAEPVMWSVFPVLDFVGFVWAANALYPMTRTRAAAMAVVCLSQPPSQHNSMCVLGDRSEGAVLSG